MVSGILELIKPVEHQFDNRNKFYLRNNKYICRFDEIQDIYYRSRTGGLNGQTSWWELYLVIRSGKPIKLMKKDSEDQTIMLRNEMISAIGLELASK